MQKNNSDRYIPNIMQDSLEAAQQRAENMREAFHRAKEEQTKLILETASLRAEIERLKGEAIAFADWLWDNRWFRKENDKWHHTFEMGTAMSRKTYEKNYVKTTAELYQLFTQNKEGK